MSSLTYNGIQLEILDTLNFEQKAQYSADGATYLYTRFEVEVECIYNPKATSYRPSVVGAKPAPNDSVPLQMADQMAGITTAALHHKLSQPRGKLLYQDGNAILLESPLPGYTVDAANGPFVEFCHVALTGGERTYTVKLKFVTHLKLCSGSNPLLSNRWKRTHTIDQDYFSTIITEGEASFRTDLLVRLGAYPDQYRHELFHPVPPRCNREQITVIPNSEGTGVTYRYVDRETPFTVANLHSITRIEGYLTGSWSRAGVWRAFWEALPDVASSPRQLFGMMRRTTPRYVLHCMVRIWGTKNSTRGPLTYAALRIIKSYFGAALFNSLKQNELIITHDITGKFVEVQYSVDWGPEQVLTIIGSNNELLPFFQDIGAATPDGIGSDARPPYINSTDDFGGGLPPNSFNRRGDRGTWLGALVHQVLTGACTAIPTPPEYSNTIARDSDAAGAF